MKWRQGIAYEHKALPGLLIHVVGKIPTTLYGEIFVAETSTGGLLPLPEHEADEATWSEAPLETWERATAIARSRPKIAEVVPDGDA